MERKTRVAAETGRQEIIITREFDLPVELLFKAYEAPEILAQWMGTHVLKLDNRPHGSYRFETTDAQGKAVFRANGVIHEFVPNEKITRTFEMEGAPFPVQLEFLEFEPLAGDKSRLTMHIIFKTAAHRDHLLRMPFAQGISMAHDRLQNILNNLK